MLNLKLAWKKFGVGVLSLIVTLTFLRVLRSVGKSVRGLFVGKMRWKKMMGGISCDRIGGIGNKKNVKIVIIIK